MGVQMGLPLKMCRSLEQPLPCHLHAWTILSEQHTHGHVLPTSSRTPILDSHRSALEAPQPPKSYHRSRHSTVGHPSSETATGSELERPNPHPSPLVASPPATDTPPPPQNKLRSPFPLTHAHGQTLGGVSKPRSPGPLNAAASSGAPLQLCALSWGPVQIFARGASSFHWSSSPSGKMLRLRLGMGPLSRSH
ncbi:hypothetical protein VUR80DRAFT_6972 [Thermomyces stellatus]